MGIKKCRTYADFETVEKNAKNSLTKKLQAKKGAKLGIFLFYATGVLICKSFWQITFLGCTFFHIISMDLKSA
jgi:hypothetical protein